MTDFIADTSVLSSFARTNHLSLLPALLDGSRVLTTPEVLKEVRDGVPQHPGLGVILAAEWLAPVSLSTAAELSTFAACYRRADLGESTVLAYAKHHGAVVLLDDKVGRVLAQEQAIAFKGSLWLLARALHQQLLDEPQVSRLIDAMRACGSRLPCTGADFLPWAHQNGLLPVVPTARRPL